MKTIQYKKITLAVVAAFAFTGCSIVTPKQFSQSDLMKQAQADRATAVSESEPVVGELGIDEAVARALKYNLDRRAKMMEEALALRQVDVSQIDMLPKLLAQSGYTSRDNDRISLSRNPQGTAANDTPYVSQERSHTVSSLGLSWNLLDLGVGYSNSLQQADRALIAGEKRRKAMHLLVQDVRTAFWRALSAQKLRAKVVETTRLAEAALADSRKAEQERVRNPLDALRYQRQVLENLRLLEAIDQELSTAQVELATLINAPVGQPIVLQEPELRINREILAIPVEQMEEAAMTSNADSREQNYNARIAREETRKTLIKMFPSITFNYGANYDTDSYLVNNHWNEAGAQISFNLFNLLTGPTQMKLANAGVALADQRRVAVQMAVLSQVHLGRMHFANAVKQFERADAIWETDRKIAEHVQNRESAQAQSKLDLVANQTTAILSLMRRYQAMSQVYGAEAKLQATLGVEPKIGSVSAMTLSDLTAQVGQGQNSFAQLVTRAQAEAAAPVVAEEKPAAVEQQAPAVEEKTSAVEQLAPAVEEKTAAVEQQAPVVEEKVAAVEEKSAAVQEQISVVEEKLAAVEPLVVNGVLASAEGFVAQEDSVAK